MTIEMPVTPGMADSGNLPESRFEPGVHDDLFALSARAQSLTRDLHGRTDVVVQLKSDLYHDPEHVDETRATHFAPGHFNVAERVLVVNLDDVCDFEPDHGAAPERFLRLSDFNSPRTLVENHPVLAGVLAHELAHARWTGYLGSPEGYAFMSPAEQMRIENLPGIAHDIVRALHERRPDLDIRPEDLVRKPSDKRDEARQARAVATFSEVNEVVTALEEARIERLIQDGGPGMVYSKPWRDAVKSSASHLVVEGFRKLADEGTSDRFTALRAMGIVYGRTVSGVLNPFDATVADIIAECARVIDEIAPTPDDPDVPTASERAMRIVRDATYLNSHEDSRPIIDCAIDLLDLLVPPPSGGDGEGEQGEDEQEQESEGSGGGKSDGDGEPGESDESEGDADGEGDAPSPTGAFTGRIPETSGDFAESLEESGEDLAASAAEARAETRRAEGEDKQVESNVKTGHGSVLFDNPNAPWMYRQEEPTKQDYALYHSVRSWLERSMSPTVTESHRAGWMPLSDAEFDVDQYVYDELAGNTGDERGEWRKRDWLVKTAPPMKIGIMLDCSGSMGNYTRTSASVAWALQAAASDLPGSEVCSVAYGSDACITVQPGRVPPRTLNIMSASAGTENWRAASEILDEQLRLSDAIANDEADPTGESKTNGLIIVVSDFQYRGYDYNDKGEPIGLTWAERAVHDLATWRRAGFRVVVVGPYDTESIAKSYKAWHYSGNAAEVDAAFEGVDHIGGYQPEDMAREFDLL